MIRNLGIRAKVLIVLSAVAITAVGVNGYLGYRTAKESLEAESFNKLTAVREMKASQIEDYFRQIADQVQTFSEDRMIIEAIKAFKSGFNAVETELAGTTETPKHVDTELRSYYVEEFKPRLQRNSSEGVSVDKFWPGKSATRFLQHLYLSSNTFEIGSKHRLDSASDDSSYTKAHRIYHPIIRSYLEKFGYYDIFLVDHETGHIVYTVFKEVDYGTSLLTGPYKDTNFADAFRAAKNAANKDFVRLVDFAPYEPSYNAPAAFIASPIFEAGQIIGVLLFQMPIDRINNIMTNKHAWADVGLGQSGETYIVGDDSLLRNQSRFLIEDRDNYFKVIQEIGLPRQTINRINNLNSTIGLQPVKTQGTEAALRSETGTQIFPDYRGVSVLSSYKPLSIADVNWVIMSEIDEAEAFAQVHVLRNNIYTWLIILIMAIVIIAFFFSKTITKPLEELTKYSQELSQHDFHAASHFQFSGTLSSITRRHDEVGGLAKSFQLMEADLETSIENLKKTTSAKERMESELNIGREIQMSMLPLIFPAYPERPEFSVHADLHPAREVGGDFYDFFFVTEDLFCFCIGDVSDKGVPAALLMAVTKTLLKSRAADDFSPASILSHVNDEVSRENKACMFVTVFLGVLNVKTGELVYANAGHNPPYLIREDHSLERLGEPHGVVIGAVENLAYQEGHNKLSGGDILLTYTDGVTEAMNVAGDLFSEKRLVDLLSSRNYESSEDIVHSVVRAVRLFERGADQADDITVMSLAFLGRQEGVEVDGFGITIKNRPADIQRIVSRFSDFCGKHTIAESVRRQVSLVFDELLNNTISYAYKDEEVHDIEIGVELSRDRLTIRISDDGIPFNPFGLQDPDTSLSLEDREVGGLGIHIVRNVMDEVSYQRKIARNLVTLVKRIANKESE